MVRARSWVLLRHALDEAVDGVALDGLALAAGSGPQACSRDAIDVAEAATGRLVEHGDRFGREDLAVAADLEQPCSDVVGRVLRTQRVDGEPPVQTRVQRAIAAETQAVL